MPNHAVLQALVYHLVELIRMHPSADAVVHSLSIAFGPLIMPVSPKNGSSSPEEAKTNVLINEVSIDKSSSEVDATREDSQGHAYSTTVSGLHTQSSNATFLVTEATHNAITERVQVFEYLLTCMLSKTLRILEDVQAIAYGGHVARKALMLASAQADGWDTQGSNLSKEERRVLKLFAPPSALVGTNPVNKYKAIVEYVEERRAALIQESALLEPYDCSRLAEAIVSVRKEGAIEPPFQTDWRRPSEKVVAAEIRACAGEYPNMDHEMLAKRRIG